MKAPVMHIEEACALPLSFTMPAHFQRIGDRMKTLVASRLRQLSLNVCGTSQQDVF